MGANDIAGLQAAIITRSDLVGFSTQTVLIENRVQVELAASPSILKPSGTIIVNTFTGVRSL